MKKFLVKSISFFLVLTLVLSIFLWYFGGYIDYFYEKFTTPKAHSMIIGDSRAMQGIQPSIIDKNFSKNEFEGPMLNYSFTIAQSHIGPLYTKSILKKLDKSTKNGLFIISINPWMLSSLNDNNNYNGEFIEKGAPPHNMSYVSMSPNFEYFLKNYNYFHFRALFKKKAIMHKDGWLQENNVAKDSSIFKTWKINQINLFKNFSKNYYVSDYRKKSLDTLVDELKKYGEVYLIRTPVDKEMYLLENLYYKDFHIEINKLALKYEINYYNFNEAKESIYKTYDGHHIDQYGGALFTHAVCDSIKTSL
jgi:hypothetical protein